MPSLTLHDRLIWFAHCPKAGGTTIEQFMVAQWGDGVGHLHWGWDLWWRGGGWRSEGPANSPQHLVWDDALETLPSHPDLVFAIVRDPVTRMQSEYRWQRQSRRGTRLGRALSYLPFGLWLRVMLSLAERHPYAFDNHFRPQSAFVPEGAKVFKLEEGLDPALCWLAVQTGVSHDPDEVKHTNTTGRATPIASQAVARIVQVFGEDYSRFGYPKPKVDSPVHNWVDRGIKTLVPGLVWLDRRGRL